MSARQLRGVVSDHRVDPERERCNVLCEVGGGKAVMYAFFVDYMAQRHIGGNAVVEHHHVLAHHGKLCAQGAQFPFGQSVPIDQNGP
ncbi:hypothetical protein D3C71_1575000 [compost metagenome]